MSEKVKILLIVPVFRRPEVTKLCYQGIKLLEASAPEWCQITPLIVWSLKEDFLQIPPFWLNVFAPNNCLGLKMNVAVHYAAENLAFDYLMQLDSDGIIHPALLDIYHQYFQAKAPFFGCNRILFHNEPDGRTLDYTLMNSGVWVTGRAIHRDLIEQMGRELWEWNRESGVGVNMENLIRERTGTDVRIIHTAEPLMIDIKGQDNVSKFEHLARNPRESREVFGAEREKLLKRFNIKPKAYANPEQ